MRSSEKINNDKLSEILYERGYVHQFSAGKLEEITDAQKRVVYLGLDPSADSLHVGHLQAMLVLRRFLEDGHKVIVLIGGGTGMIGDPSGKSEERNLLDEQTIERNSRGIRKQAEQLFGGLEFTLRNNADWLKKLDLIPFLRDIGKFFSVNAMLQRDSVKDRLNREGEGISYTEFSYMLLQAYDYLHLHKELKCDVQIGSSDQWGNIASGIDLIKRKTGDIVYGFTSSLLVNKSTGKKFGKSEGGAVWLDETKTSFFDFYQFWVNVPDDSLQEYMLRMTVMPKEEIDRVMQVHAKSPKLRYGQNRLAYEVTKLVHGTEKAERAGRVSRVLFGKDGTPQPVEQVDWKLLYGDVPNSKVAAGTKLSDAIVSSGLASSKREARQFLTDGAITLNYHPEKEDRNLDPVDFVNGHTFLQRGKRNIAILILKQ